jgi:flavin reductase (DIM6/NTAB) family NADH-FMN oxidoreductase RutF
MGFEHDSSQPANLAEDWEGQYSIFSWMACVSAIPHVIYVVTTLKENGLPNAALEGWSCFSGEGDHYYVVMTTLMTHTHTYRNILRTGEFCVNFLSPDYVDGCKESISNNGDDTDEIVASGFTPEPSHAIAPPRIQESFLKLECQYEWEKELHPNSRCRMLCGKVRHISVSDDFAHSSVADRYGRDSFMVHLMAMRDPYTGERLRGGVGHIELTREMEL